MLDPLTSRPRPACDVIAQLVLHVAPALRRCGDEDLVNERVEGILARGSGATRQRMVFEGTGRLHDVIAMLARATVGEED